MAAFIRAEAQRPLHFSHVKGHSGCRGNELADRLAAQGARGRRCASRRWSEPPERAPKRRRLFQELREVVGVIMLD